MERERPPRIEERLKTGQPSEIARAIMTAGLSENSDFNASALHGFKDAVGFLGTAYQAATYAYDRNKWAGHWYELMCETANAEDFWCAAVQFSKVVDGQIDTWERPAWDECRWPFQLFWPSVEKGLRARLSKWQSQREKKLFGGSAPGKIFLKEAASR